MYECLLQLPMFGREAPGHWILGVITKAFVNNPGLAAAQFFITSALPLSTGEEG
jgi:hypothetical protein